jgi:alkylation response protein AidB-like acyl-CoA dehydrogenase
MTIEGVAHESSKTHVNARELTMDADNEAASQNTSKPASEKPQFGTEINGSAAADRLLAKIDALAPEIAARASEAEAARRIPDDIVQALKASDVFRMTVPKTKGGLELDFPSAVRILQRLTKIDGSVGWLSTIATGFGIIMPLMQPQTYDEVYQHGPNVMFAGSSAPAGTAEAVEGGWRINGRWPFASGCEDADWICVSCVLTRDGQRVPGPVEGTPATSFAILSARHAKIDDTWYSSGLKATGSHHIAFQDVTAAAKDLFDPATARPSAPGPLYSAPMQLATLLHGSLALGMAEGALDDIVAMAQSGRRQQRATAAMRDSEIFQYELGRVQAKLRAAQTMLDAVVASYWQHALAGTLRTEAKFAEATQSAIWMTETCLSIVQTCFTLGGGAAVFDSTPLQRRLRDIEVAAQHAGVHRRHYAQTGRLLLSKSS